MLNSQIESILFVSSGPVEIKLLAKICGRSKDEVEVAVEALKDRYNHNESGINIVEHQGKVEMVSSPDNGRLVASVVKEEIYSDLTRPQLETLTVIAYRGPITKFELEQIRGVNCSLILRNLLIKGLVEVKKDKIIDNDVYNISIDFMKHLGINSVVDLPDYEELSKSEVIGEVLRDKM